MYGPGIPLNALKHKEVSSTTHARLSFFFFNLKAEIPICMLLGLSHSQCLSHFLAILALLDFDEKKYNQHLMHLSQNLHLRFIGILLVCFSIIIIMNTFPVTNVKWIFLGFTI